jgi:hypothetical protein
LLAREFPDGHYDEVDEVSAHLLDPSLQQAGFEVFLAALEVVPQVIPEPHVPSLHHPPHSFNLLVELIALLFELSLQVLALERVRLEDFHQLLQLLHFIGVSPSLPHEMHVEGYCLFGVESVAISHFRSCEAMDLELQEQRGVAELVVGVVEGHEKRPRQHWVESIDVEDHLVAEVVLGIVMRTMVRSTVFWRDSPDFLR